VYAQEGSPDRLESASHVSLDGTKRHAGLRGDLAVGHAVAGGEQEDAALLGAQLLEGARGLGGLGAGVGAVRVVIGIR